MTTWLLSNGSQRAHALREKPVKVREPGARLSWCGRVAWHRRADQAPLTMLRCAACERALSRVA